MTSRAGIRQHPRDDRDVVAAGCSLPDERTRSTGCSTDSLAAMRQIHRRRERRRALTLPYERALNIGGRGRCAPGAERIPIMNMTYVTPDTSRRCASRSCAAACSPRPTRPARRRSSSSIRRSSRATRPDLDPIGRQMRTGGRAAHDRRHRRRHPAESRLGQLRPGRRGAGELHSRGADRRRLPDDGARVVFAELVRARARAAGGHRRPTCSARSRGRSAASVREVPHPRRRPRRSGRHAARAGAAARDARRRWRCCSRRSVSMGWSRTPSPSGRASSASGSRSARRRARRSPSAAAAGVGPRRRRRGDRRRGRAPRRVDDAPSGVGRVVSDPLTFAAAIGDRARWSPSMAALVPALRIVRLNPISALRQGESAQRRSRGRRSSSPSACPFKKSANLTGNLQRSRGPPGLTIL